MNITSKIIITDTNIITDLDNANILEEFVMLDNVYINDMIKNDEINSNTGNINIINKFKTFEATQEQITEIFHILQEEKGLSPYDIINYIIAKDNNAILATGDKKLGTFSEKNGIEVIKTLKIIKLMKNKNIITTKKAITACELLKENKSTRIPIERINETINELKEELVIC